METRSGNIALTAVISRTGSGGTGKRDVCFSSVAGYCAAMALARQMLQQRLIDQEEYRKIGVVIGERHGLPVRSIFGDTA